MRLWGAYKITHHGEETYPVFLTKHQHTADRFLDWCDSKGFDSSDEYLIKRVNIKVPKLGLMWKRRRSKGKIVHETDILLIKEAK